MALEPVPDAVRVELALHVDAIIRRSAIPAAERGDVEEELAGHLEERYRAARGAGRTPEAAVVEAIAEFGQPDVVGSAFVAAYHSRIWASTIGQLLPIMASRDSAPGGITWTIRFLRVLAVLSVLAAVLVVATWPPVRAAIAGVLALVGAAILWLSAEGLRRRQSWAVRAACVALVIQTAIFFASLFPRSGSVNITLNGLAGLILVLWMIGNLEAVRAWVAGSRPISAWLQAGVIGGLLAATLPLVPDMRLPDPTQIGPADIEAVASVTCVARPRDEGEPMVPSPTVDLQVHYRRVDLAPRGLWQDGWTWGDAIFVWSDPISAAFRPTSATMTDGPAGTSRPVDVTAVVDPGPGVRADGTGSMFVIGSDDGTIGAILGADQQAGRTFRIHAESWLNVGDGRPAEEIGTPLDGMSVEVRLVHLDRFALGADLGCGQSGPLVLADVP